MDPEKWECLESLNKNSSSGVMVSNLPLVFTHGYPTCLENMTQAGVEAFVPFMVRCSSGDDLKTSWSDLPRPSWWPSKLPFRVPTAKNVLIKIIERCYAFHGCEYLLHFCKSLVNERPEGGYRFTDNRDGTSSMYDGTTGKLLVTFRNENREYDQQILRRNQSSRKKLLLPPTTKKKGIMVQNPISDIYLCDKCDDEFLTLKEVQKHEKLCSGDRPEPSRPLSPEPDIFEEEIDTSQQVPFLSYLALQPCKHTGLVPYKSPRKKSNCIDRKLFGSSYTRFEAIELSSPLGKYIGSKSRFGGRYHLPQSSVLKYERHVYAIPESNYISTREKNIKRWINIWKANKVSWFHLYCFNKKQRTERLHAIQTGLDARGRNLLIECKGLRVKLERLTKLTIDRNTKLGKRCVPCIDLTSPEEPHVQYDPPFINTSEGRTYPLQVSPVNGLLKSGTKLPAETIYNLPKYGEDRLNIDNKIKLGNTVQTYTEQCIDMHNEIDDSEIRNNTIAKLRRQNVLSQNESFAKKIKLKHEESANPLSNNVACSLPSITPCPLIEIIDLSSDDEVDSSCSLDRSNARSKNGYSHWLPQNSLLYHDTKKRCLAIDGTTSCSVSLKCPCHHLQSCSHNSCSYNNHCLRKYMSRKLDLDKGIKNFNNFLFCTTERVRLKLSKGVNSAINLSDQMDYQCPSSSVYDEILSNSSLQKISPKLDSSLKSTETNFIYSLASRVNESLNNLHRLMESSISSALSALSNCDPELQYQLLEDSEKYPLKVDKSFKTKQETHENTFLLEGSEIASKITPRSSMEKVDMIKSKLYLRSHQAKKCKASFKKKILCSGQIKVDDEISFKNHTQLLKEFGEIHCNDLYKVKALPCVNEVFVPNLSQGVLFDQNSKSQTSPDQSNYSPCILLERLKIKSNYSKIDKSSSTSNIKKGTHSDTLIKRPGMRELKNLERDECKEWKDSGFHPIKILSDCEIINNNHIYNNEGSNSPARTYQNSLMSFKRTTPSKKINCFVSQESVRLMMESSKKLNRELSNLMMDEWKELKRCGAHPSQLPQLLSNTRQLRSFTDTSVKISKYSKKSKVFSNDWVNHRSSKRIIKLPVMESVRNSHRNLIVSHGGMCVINYEIQN